MTRDLDDEKVKIDLKDLQLTIVDKIEAYHQQVYSAIGALILVLNHVRIKGTKKDHPINSVQKFLKFLRDEPYKYRSSLHQPVFDLLKSVEFRAKFVDHPQNHPVSNWMTFAAHDYAYVIYFNPLDEEESEEAIDYYEDDLGIEAVANPESPYFRPPIQCKEDFFVSPNPLKSLIALEVICIHLLDLR